ncbi:TonB-dependent receptor [Zunongwangia atlantica]|uniref:TonB-dependent outer membrane receptor n=1 Tax=Zunongwangia atlantica 22II14-10F7 TaxID=1185767 RepID=A0A1Y1T0X1_9FLAO|nr:TonB-dependent receptor [Zunongwangia atlantica]ORL44670.1 TonB-dependent outer membrane receptor [Zunongwangia atlantica 22II14-10F7]
MNKFLVLIAFLLTTIVNAQETTGSIAGKLTDREMNGEPLPFANVTIKGTSKGTTSDYDGLYVLDKIEPGTYTVVFSFIGYETLEIPNVQVVADKITEINTDLGASAASLDEVVITTVSRRDSEVALLLEQKGAIDIKESIGAQELAKLGVSDAGTATTKISGVTSSEASGDIFVRGLGDRYLYSTLNGLPIPSDDVERKNIDLGLFSTRVLNSIAISKTYSANTSADQASGNVDISTRTLRGSEELNAGLRVGVNTNVTGQFDSFKVSPNQSDATLGFYSQSIPVGQAIEYQSWNTQTADLPVNRRFALTAGKKFGDKFKLLFTGSISSKFEHRKGIFREYRSNQLYDYFSDVENFEKTDNTTALLDATYEINDDHEVKATSLFINKLTDQVYESGRNGEGVIFEETAPAEGLNQFVRDQNIKQTRILINQLHGKHRFFENNELDWGVGLNLVNADEPNRIRNEVNYDGEDFVQLGRTGGFQQRKSGQKIEDVEFNAFAEDQITFAENDSLNQNVYLQVGGNFRNKDRDFQSKFYGVEEDGLNTVNPISIDDFSNVFTPDNFDNGDVSRNNLPTDRYVANLTSYGGFATFNYGKGKWNVNLGARFQRDELDVRFRVNNYPSTRPQYSIKEYDNIYPSLNVKFSPSENSNIRLAASKTITLPEFKEIAPFEYVSQTGQVTRGNPNLDASTNYNLDLKYEFFPSNGQLVSLTGFYKKIEDPINKVQDRGAAGVFSYFNAGEEANIYGIELETRVDIIDSEDENAIDFGVGFNASRMWHKQDLKDVYEDGTFIRTFQYNNKTEVGLQGASDWIFNGSLNFSTENSDRAFRGSIVANYQSDKIYALGAPEVQTQTDVFYNDEIVEKGFVTLDAIISKNFGENWSVQFRGQNLLNPEIERYQAVRPSTTGIEADQTVRSYSRGAVLSLGVGYSF